MLGRSQDDRSFEEAFPYKAGGACMRLSQNLRPSPCSSDISADGRKWRLYLGSAVDHYTTPTWMTVGYCGGLGVMRNDAVVHMYDRD